MTDTVRKEINELLAPMLKMTLYVGLSKAVASSEEMLPFVAEHLRYMNALEQKGLLFGSGPFVQDGVLVGDGLTILRASSLEHAQELMEDEPLIKRRMRSFELRKWELREGRIVVQLDASRSQFTLT
jgi:uncharacterized protein